MGNGEAVLNHYPMYHYTSNDNASISATGIKRFIATFSLKKIAAMKDTKIAAVLLIVATLNEMMIIVRDIEVDRALVAIRQALAHVSKTNNQEFDK